MADNLILAHLATAAGDMIVVSPTSHPDLLWGLRGAGHNFGIVTKAVFKIYDQTNGGQQFNADITYAEDQLEALFTAINAFEQTPETSVVVVLVPIPGSTVHPPVSFPLLVLLAQLTPHSPSWPWASPLPHLPPTPSPSSTPHSDISHISHAPSPSFPGTK